MDMFGRNVKLRNSRNNIENSASMYPSLLLAYDFYPNHLGKAFTEVYAAVKEERIKAKHAGNKNKDTTLKLLLNSVTGYNCY